MRVIWDEKAWDDLEGIYKYHELENVDSAKSICLSIYKESSLLENSPLLGKVEPYANSKKYSYRSLVTCIKKYKIVYYIDKNTIHIAGVWDCRRDPLSMADLYE